MWDWTDRIGVIVFDAALSTAVFLTLVVLVMLACRQPARRILLARVALVAALAILPLVALGRLPRLDVIDTLVESRFFPRTLFLVPAPADEAPVASPGPGGGVRVVSGWLGDSAATAKHWLARGLTLLDITGVAAGCAWLILGVAGAHWLIHRSRPPLPATRAVFDELLASRSRALARTGLRVCTRLRHPVVTGLFRPTILIPEGLDRAEGDAEPLRLSLLHELAHAERSDHWFSTAASTAQAIWFFIPQVWWIRAQLLIDQEFLADRAAAEHYGSSSDYASALLALVAPAKTGSAPVPRNAERETAPGGTIGVQSPLLQRMMMLLHCPYPVEARTPRVWSWTSRVAVVIASVATACLVIRWPHASLAVSAQTATSPRSPFQVASFVAEPYHEAAGAERSLVYSLPVALPREFELDVEFRSREADFSQIRIAGQPLGLSRSGNPSIPVVDTAIWHRVHLHAAHHRIAVIVDGREIPGPTRDGPATGWLTVEPPAHASVEFRGLTVRW